MFTVKAGYTPQDSNPFVMAGLVTAAAAIGSFGFLFIAMQYPDIKEAFFHAYGQVPEVVKQARYSSLTEKAYIENTAPWFRYVKMWFVMTKNDGFSYFFATLLALSLNGIGTGLVGIIMRIISTIVGAILFVFVIYGDQLFPYMANFEFSPLISKVIDHIREEVRSTYNLIMIPFRGTEITFGGWLHQEVLKMGGSIYKFTSIYPKLILVFLATSIIPRFQ